MEVSCLRCHAGRGCTVGDVRGGAGVSFDISPIEKEMTMSRIIITVLIVLGIGCLMGVLYLFIRRLWNKIILLQNELAHFAITDELTGLSNRRHFFTRFNEELFTAERYGHPLSCILLDIDFLKLINDTYGHSTGDLVIKRLGGLIREFCRTTDTAARYGSEEIAMLLTETDSFGAYTVAEKIREAVKQHPFESADGAFFRINISLGVVTIAPRSDEAKLTAERILSLAEESLCQAKDSGRDRTVVYGREDFS